MVDELNGCSRVEAVTKVDLALIDDWLADPVEVVVVSTEGYLTDGEEVERSSMDWELVVSILDGVTWLTTLIVCLTETTGLVTDETEIIESVDVLEVEGFLIEVISLGDSLGEDSWEYSMEIGVVFKIEEETRHLLSVQVLVTVTCEVMRSVSVGILMVGELFDEPVTS